ncbi:MAG: hypothetical protein QY331_00605 [Melioribacteraceae bacterium]|nr:MAG: hypothetical protein QY331_00605 [Melioribacteraceae bacterium]
MKAIKMFFLVMLVFLLASCSSIKLEPANFAWPIESVVATDDNGNVAIERYSTEFNASALFRTELGDSVIVPGRELRIIRDNLGNYLMTSQGFMNVYVFIIDEGAFVQTNKIFISKEGMTNPAFNQRTPNIELVDNEITYIIDSKGSKRK